MDSEARVSSSGFDVVVIGAGVVGLAVAAAFASERRSVLVLEREARIASGITSRNSEVMHAGFYYPRNSLKAELCVAGRALLSQWCAEMRVDSRRLGKLVVATSDSEEPLLEALLAQGLENGVGGLELIDREEIARLEPQVAASRALHSAETGIVDGQGLCQSLLGAAEAKGAVLALGREVKTLTASSFGWRLDILTSDATTESVDAGFVVDCAGLAADRVAELAGLDVDKLGWRQHACKGDYFSLIAGSELSLGHLVYPVPEQSGLGIHATLDLAGRIRFGPDAEYVETVKYDVSPVKVSVFAEAIRRYLPSLREANLVPDYAGIRPRLALPGEGFRDFVIEETSGCGAPGFVACIGIESPGLTAALAIANRVAAFGSF